MRDAYLSAEGVRTVSIAYVEATAALARARAGGRVSAPSLRSGLAGLRDLWAELSVHSVNDALIELAAREALARGLRGYDALHLAAAVAFAEGEAVEFACWDRQLRAAAAEHGFQLVPR